MIKLKHVNFSIQFLSHMVLPTSISIIIFIRLLVEKKIDSKNCWAGILTRILSTLIDIFYETQVTLITNQQFIK